VSGVNAAYWYWDEPGRTYFLRAENTNYTTLLKGTFLVSPQLRLSSLLDVNYSEEFANGSFTGALSWIPFSFIRADLNYSEIWRNFNYDTDDVNFASDTDTKSYSLNIPISILPTLNLQLGATRSETHRDAQRESLQSNYHLGAQATLYPDLTASLTGEYNTITSFKVEGIGIETSVYSATFLLNASINPKLRCRFSNTYSVFSKQESEESGDSSTVTVNYYPSDMLNMELRLYKTWIGDATIFSQQGSLNMSLLRTNKTRLTFSSQFKHIEDIAINSYLQADWNISRILFLKGAAGYILGGANSWYISSRFYINF
jgi:hypothetical protein